MKHQLYFPSRQSAQNLWLQHFKSGLPEVAEKLNLPEARVQQTLKDLVWLIHVCGELQTQARAQVKACTALMGVLRYGKGTRPLALPTGELPPPPPGEPPAPSALRRVFKMVQLIKNSPGYTKGLGVGLGIEGNLHTVNAEVPVFRLKAVRGAVWEMARLDYRRYGHLCVEIQTRRGGGDWEPLGTGLFGGARAEDDRPLLVAGTPEIREYRMRFWDGPGSTAPWSDVATVTISP